MQAAALVFDSKISVRRIQELMTSRVIPAYPRLTHKMCPLPLTAGSARCWLPDERYDIKRHVFADDVHLSDDRLLRVRRSRRPLVNSYGRREGAQYQVPGARCQVPGARCQVSGVRCQVPGARCQVPRIYSYSTTLVSRTRTSRSKLLIFRL